MPSESANARPEAIILSAGTNALGAVRSLTRVGVPTIVLAQSPDEPALRSRYPVLRLAVPRARQSDRDVAVLEHLASLAQSAPRRVLIPTSDYFVSLMMRHQASLAKSFDFCIPPPELTHVLLDKSLETKLIESLGIPMPATVQDLPESWGVLRKALRIPIIIKPRTFAEVAVLGGKNRILRTEEEGENFYREFIGRRDAFLAQEVIPGDDDTLWVCNCTFNHAGEMVEAFSFRRLRLTPAHFGVTSYAESLHNREALKQCESLGEGMKYVGPAMIEFKFDERDGKYKYIEVNPRIGLCNYFDTICGINNVWNTYQLARGVQLKPTGRIQRERVMYLELVEDFLCRWREGESPLGIVGHYLRNAGRRHVGAYSDWRDPWPGLWSGLRETRRLRGVARRAGRMLGINSSTSG